MIVRYWRGVTYVDAAEAYQNHLDLEIFPQLDRIAGHHRSQILRRHIDDGFEFVVLTFWESMEAIREFAGPNCEVAVVPPEAQVFLKEFDSQVTHYDLIHH